MLLIAIGVGLTATAIGFLLDRATDEQRLINDGYRSDIDDLRQKIDIERSSAEKFAIERLRLDFKALRSKFKKQVKELYKNSESIRAEYSKVIDNINYEINADGISLFRKRALLQGFCQIQDGLGKLDAYSDYLDWYRDSLDVDIQELTSERLLQLVDEMQPPSPFLPLEWLYVGKVLLLEPGELNKKLKFDNVIRLSNYQTPQGFTDSAQQALFMAYPDQTEIPVQIVGKDKRKEKLHFACVARGILYWDCILAGEPFEVQVKKFVGQGYLVEAFEGVIKAFLPISLTDNPFVKLIEGECVSVWPELHNLLLDDIPSGSKHKRFSVSMRRPIGLGEASNAYIALVIHNESYSTEIIQELSSGATWRLQRFSADDSRLFLMKGNYIFECRIDNGNFWLIVEHVCVNESVDSIVSGYEIPFHLLPVDDRVLCPELGNEASLSGLIAFAMQLENFESDSRARFQQLEMLSQWGEIIDFQNRHQNELEFELKADLFSVTDGWGEITLSAKSLYFEEYENESFEKYDFLAKRLSQQKNSYPPRIKIRFWGELLNQEMAWISPVAKRKDREISIELLRDRGIKIRFPIEEKCEIFDDGNYTDKLVRLEISLGDQSIMRQRKGLKLFKRGDIANIRIKDILLSPGAYSGEACSEWLARIKYGLSWGNPVLTENQKKVVEGVLSEKFVALVQGPPGTAKTTCIVEILHQIFSFNPLTRVLVVSQQNAAVDNAMSRFVEKHTELVDSDCVRVLRLGKEDKIDAELINFSLLSKQDKFLSQSKAAALATLANGTEPGCTLASQWISGFLGGFSNDSGSSKLDGEITWAILKNHNLVGATCVGLASRFQNMDQLVFDVVIIDEAGRSTVPELILPILKAKKVILIGDHFQLPPSIAPILLTDDSKERLPFLDKNFLEESFFERLHTQLPAASKYFLSEQFRMPKDIGNLVGEMFYTNAEGLTRLTNGKIKDESNFLFPETIAWIDVPGAQEQEGTSKRNKSEVSAIINFIKTMKVKGCNRKDIEVAIITPYSAQKSSIRRALAKISDSTDDGIYKVGSLNIKIDTVDSFQGSEADIVLYSVVRTKGDLSFILDWRRLNVACSRAKENLFFFGHVQFLLNKRMPDGERNLFCEILSRIPEENCWNLGYSKNSSISAAN
ncbi:hypothetical protein D0C16_12490 [Cellvibrio sp. KY-GH-1]|uniref:AAA domain-containing protein n=1 Tax=Cellvibrio sp. KY-GH-1 TaxID=2303332 RepID=UPI001245E8AA|nr:AAA domain-containing protein [Cellvibrio sp. KY-GH-1]QEY16713.1 hypothetical protein D0C16_12490 [Cellvibrio sp. KY-GH-1]